MDYPAAGDFEYRIARRWRVFVYVVTPPLLLLLLGMPTWEWLRDSGGTLWLVGYSILPVSVALLLLWGLLEAAKGRIIIDERQIIRVSSLTTNTLLFEEIKGYQVEKNYLKFMPIDSRKSAIKVSLLTERVEEIIYWATKRYPNLTSEKDSSSELPRVSPLSEPFAELTTLQRKVAEAYQTARILNLASCLTLAWLLLLPTPYSLVISAGILLPLGAVSAQWLYADFLRPDEPDSHAIPSLAITLILPSIGLFIRMLLDAELVSIAIIQPWAYSVGGGFALMLLIGSRKALFGKSSDMGQAIIIFVAAVLYGYSAPVAGNVAFDTAAPTHHSTRLIAKYINPDELVGFTAKVEAWGPYTTSNIIHVRKAHYQRLRPTDCIHVRLMPGRLGFPWFRVVE